MDNNLEYIQLERDIAKNEKEPQKICKICKTCKQAYMELTKPDTCCFIEILIDTLCMDNFINNHLLESINDYLKNKLFQKVNKNMPEKITVLRNYINYNNSKYNYYFDIDPTFEIRDFPKILLMTAVKQHIFSKTEFKIFDNSNKLIGSIVKHTLSPKSLAYNEKKSSLIETYFINKCAASYIIFDQNKKQIAAFIIILEKPIFITLLLPKSDICDKELLPDIFFSENANKYISYVYANNIPQYINKSYYLHFDTNNYRQKLMPSIKNFRMDSDNKVCLQNVKTNRHEYVNDYAANLSPLISFASCLIMTLI